MSLEETIEETRRRYSQESDPVEEARLLVKLIRLEEMRGEARTE